MKRILLGAALLLPASALAQYTPVTATHVRLGGADIANGSVTMTLLDRNGAAQPFVTADGALQGPQGFTATVTNGAIAAGFAPPDMCTAVATTPNTPLHYRIAVTKQIDSTHTTGYFYDVPAGNSYFCGGTAVALDHYAPAQIIPVVTGLISSSTIPSACIAPSKLYTPTNPVQNYDCVGGHYILETGTGSGSGVTPVFTIGTVTTGAAGSQAAASVNSSDPAHPVLSLTIPQGIPGTTGANGTNGTNGTTPTFTIGSVTTGAAGSSAAVTVTGTAPNYVLNFTIPQGAAGTGGSGSSVALKTNGTANGSQSVLNLVAGNNITLTDAGNGNVTVAYSTNPAYNGAIYPQQSNTGSDAFQSTCAANGAQIGGATINGIFRPYVCNTAGTRVALDAPSNVGTTGQVRTKQADGTEAWATPAAASSIALQTNGTANGSQTKLNLVAGSNVTLTDAGNGNVTVASSASSSGVGGYTMSFRNVPTIQFYNNSGSAGTTSKFGAGGELASYPNDYALVPAAATIQSLEFNMWYFSTTTWSADSVVITIYKNGSSICSGTLAMPQYHVGKLVITGCSGQSVAANDQIAAAVTLPASAVAYSDSTKPILPAYTVNLYAK